MPKQMPGYQSHQDKLTAAQKVAEEKRTAAAKKKADEAERQKQEKLEKSADKLKQAMTKKKLHVIQRIQYPGAKIGSVVHGFLLGQIIGLLLGSSVLGFEYIWGEEYDPNTNSMVGGPRFDSYKEGLRAAYIPTDEDGDISVDFIINIVITIVTLLMVVSGNASERDRKKKEILNRLEQLKGFGVDVQPLIKDLQPTVNKMLKSLSKIDRGYFDNLAAGGLDKASYETCVAIVSGYLKSHPKEYNQVIAIIDEATLPPEIVKKYGKGKTISFAAAQAMQFEK